jgi:tetratricopeptide (TPR) repeat protein
MRGDSENLRGQGLQARGRLLEAMRCYEAALAIEPDRIEAHRNLGESFAEAHTNLGAAFWMLGDGERAMEHFHRAWTLDRSYAPAFGHLGNALAEAGHLAEARAAFDRAVERSQRSGWLYRRWAEVRTVQPDDPPFEAMRRLANETASLEPDERIQLHFGLAKAYADVADYERAAAHLRSGNAQKRATIVYDEAASLARFERIRATCTQARLDEVRGEAEPSRLPIFVVGMPRAGTTLVDQVLASHSKVFGAGELNAFERTFNEVRVENAVEVPFPEAIAALTPAALRRVGSGYVERVRKLAPDKDRIVDKMPANVLFLGAIAAALPNARFVHVRRDPMDTCLSCYATLFSADQPFAYDLGELGRYYRAYDRLAEHWRAVLPAERLLEVRYEELVGDFQRVARAIVAHAGLEWDDACLRFYETPRIVRTASATQVRRPIYDSSIGRHRHFEALLRPLCEVIACPG